MQADLHQHQHDGDLDQHAHNRGERGVTFVVNKEDNPLVAAERALRLAERMVEQERFEAAKANLQLAKNQLVLLRT